MKLRNIGRVDILCLEFKINQEAITKKTKYTNPRYLCLPKVLPITVMPYKMSYVWPYEKINTRMRVVRMEDLIGFLIKIASSVKIVNVKINEIISARNPSSRGISEMLKAIRVNKG